jgi:hypothetical protein
LLMKVTNLRNLHKLLKEDLDLPKLTEEPLLMKVTVISIMTVTLTWELTLTPSDE